jgi:hypothetical protein
VAYVDEREGEQSVYVEEEEEIPEPPPPPPREFDGETTQD